MTEAYSSLPLPRNLGVMIINRIYDPEKNNVDECVYDLIMFCCSKRLIWVRGEFRFALIEHNFEPLSSCTPGTDPSQARPRTLFFYTLNRCIGINNTEIKSYSLSELKSKKDLK